MSVIYGIVHTTGKPIEKTETKTLRSKLNHVRFDREGRWQEESACVGVLLRQLIKNDAEQIPLIDGGLTICADARLDNREELAEKLGVSPEHLTCFADSALILKAYQKWGEDSPNQLLGDFAFAIYDKNRGSLFCARDHVGIRPFYYFWIDGTFCFCTLRPPLMAACPVTPTPNDAFIVAAFIRSHSALSHTVANEIYRLPPAHSLSVDAGQLKVQRYWQPESNTVLKLKNAAEYAVALREVFTQAVNCRTRTDHRVGSHLSSGLDSTSITVLAARELRKQGKSPLAFSWSPVPEQTSQKLGDERDLILDVCRQEDLECRFSKLTPEDTERQYQESVNIWGQYLLFPELKHQSTFAAEDCRVMLSGWGGDELTSFDGVRAYMADTLATRGLVSFAGEMLRLRANKSASVPGVLKEVLYPCIPDFLYYRFFKLPIWRQSESLINKNFRSVLKAEWKKRGRWQQRSVKNLQKGYFAAGNAQERIEQWAERGEACGVNYLYPVLDKRVIELVLSVPTEQFCRDGWKRYLFRTAMAGILPLSVQWNKSKYEKALGKAMQKLTAYSQEKSSEHLQEIENMPAFQRFFEPRAVHEMLAQLKQHPERVRFMRGLYFFAKFLDRSFPELGRQSLG